jgi:hypothetical protein
MTGCLEKSKIKMQKAKIQIKIQKWIRGTTVWPYFET